jgi:O-antigen biosynthesis protein
VTSEVRLREASPAAEPEDPALLGRAPTSLDTPFLRPTVRGKFLFVGEEKLCVRGVTYGTFRPGRSGELFPSRQAVARDFEAMAANGLNAVRTYTVPPRWLLDEAAGNGLYVLVGIAWEQHVDFLSERRSARSIEDRVRAAVADCAGHPSVLCYAIGNEIPSQIARWSGRRPIERHLRGLYRAAKKEDPGGLVTYVNYPPTEYLQLDFLDLLCFNVYLEDRKALDAYLVRLQNIAADLPLVLAEVGLDSRTHGETGQAAALDWQIRSAFAAGCAGTFVFAWTDEWYVSYLSSEGMADGGMDVDNWDFGLTRRDRSPKPGLEAVRSAFSDAPFGPRQVCPRISVVVCTHNGEKTLGACLEGVRELDYPDFETIVVDDGSTDSSAAIASGFGCRLISTDNHGLAKARNIGLHAATGEIVAYLDDDARPDPDWLRYLALGFADGRYAGIGGPNFPPPESPAVASCVADAPGGPTHVLVSDREAEHIPGCNMAFRKCALEDIGAFDPQFRVAGDDVDICWRLRDSGHKIGFSPAAFVWHQPRTSLGAFWRQQRGYGRAEAMLERKWPDKYNKAGGARWSGRVYGRGWLAALGRWRVYYGTWGAELFQSLYEPRRGRFSSTLLGPHWYIAIAMLLPLSLGALLWSPLRVAVPLLAVAIAVPLVAAAASAARTRAIARRTQSRRALAARWVLTTLLHVLQPLARVSGRLGAPAPPAQARVTRFAAPLPRLVTTWAETWRPSAVRLAEIESGLREAGAIVSRGGVYDRWDLQARHGLSSAIRIRMGIEEHGGGRQLVRIRLVPRYSHVTLALTPVLLVLAIDALTDGALPAAIVLGGSAIAIAARTVQSAGMAMATALQQVRGSAQGDFTVGREARRLEIEET